MVVPKKSDRLMKHKMDYDKQKHDQVYTSSEESEYNALKYDFDKGVKLLPHKLKRFQELKEKLGK